ncbi:MAG: hypothetical protein ABSC08_16925 [Bryobacteraceae bacterium]
MASKMGLEPENLHNDLSGEDATVDKQYSAEEQVNVANVKLPPTKIPQGVSTSAQGPPAAEQLQKAEREMNRFERSTIRWARTAVVMSFVAAVFVCLQWVEMHSSGTDTHDLAVQSGKQADAASKQAERMKDLAERMKDQADRTKTIADQAVVQAKAANDLARASNRSASASESANRQAIGFFRLQNRPWVGVDGEVAFDNDSFPKQVTYNLRNFGDGPALNTFMMIETMTFPTYGVEEAAKVEPMIDKQCRIAERDALPRKAGDLLLKTGKKIQSWGIGEREIKGDLVIAGCIVYWDTDGAVHRTRTCHIIGFPASGPPPKTMDTCWFQSAN